MTMPRTSITEGLRVLKGSAIEPIKERRSSHETTPREILTAPATCAPDGAQHDQQPLTNQQLVLQMYSHMKAHRKLEKEVLRRAEKGARWRQRRRSQNNDYSRSNLATPSGTEVFHRQWHVPPLQNRAGSAGLLGYSTLEIESKPKIPEISSQRQMDTLESSAGVMLEPSTFGTKSENCETKQEPKETDHYNQVGHDARVMKHSDTRVRNLKENDDVSGLDVFLDPSFQKHRGSAEINEKLNNGNHFNDHHNGESSNQHGHSTTNGPSHQHSRHNGFHVIRGPGRIKIKFDTTNISPRSLMATGNQRAAQTQTKAVLSGRLSLLTIDGSKLQKTPN